MKRLRPLEWGVLAFLLFVVARAGPRAFLAWTELAGLRTVSVFLALALVGTVGLLRQFRWTPWPSGNDGLARRHRAFLPIALTPLALVLGLVLTNPSFHTELQTVRAPQALPWISSLALRVVGAGAPGVLLWVLIGLELKRAGRVTVGPWLRENVRALGATLREWSPLLFILSAYAWMDAVVGAAGVEGLDEVMQAADRALFAGHDPLDLLAPLINRPTSEWLAFAYSFYAVLFPLVLGAVFLSGGQRAFREAAFALGFSLLVAYVSYTLVPVKGPVLFRSFDVSLELYLLASVKEAMMDATRITYDCFPSMHTCCTVLLSWSAWRAARQLFWWTLPVVVSIPLACVYLRYHYVVDVLAGLGLAAATIVLTRRLSKLLAR